jgi:2'-hydroxyisoflavone reductase
MRSTRRRFFGQLTGGAASLWVLGCQRKGGSQSPNDAPQVPREAITPAPRPEDFARKTLLVLGGTGFLGPHVVEAAAARGWEITLFNRGKTNPHLFPELEKLQGDRDGDLGELEGRRFRAVIDTSGHLPRIVRASAELLAPHVGQYMFVSSVSAYANFKELGITEEYASATLEDPSVERVDGSTYGGLKAACEAVAEEILPGRTTRVRPGLIVGPGDPTDRFTYWPARLDEGGEVLAPGTPDDPIQVIDVRDLAAWMVGALEQVHVGVYNLVGPFPPTTIGGLLTACQEHATAESTLVWAGKEFLEAQEVQAWTQMPVWVPPGDEGFEGFAQISGQRAIDTGLQTRPISQTVRDTLAWWREQSQERRTTLRAGISRDREQDLIAAWRTSQDTREARASRSWRVARASGLWSG